MAKTIRLALCAAALLLSSPRAAAACAGDCNGDERVTVGELVLAVNIVLGDRAIAACPAADGDGDGVVVVDELLDAVVAALEGCPPPPVCGDGSAEDGEECDDGNRIDGDGCTSQCDLETGGDACAGVPGRAGTALKAVLFAGGLLRPVHVTAPPLDPHRVFIVEQPGLIRVVKRGILLADPFLAIEDRVRCCGERGLLGLAFHPDFETNGRFFVNYTNRAGHTVIARYQVGADPDRADATSERILITIPQPFQNHNGGQLAFGPDGFLYIGMGDGGSGGDPLENGQSDETLLGKLLRLNVDVEAPPFHAVPASNPNAEVGLPLGLIWAKGLRNPWRFSFDRGSGDLYIGDVGQSRFEEVDVQPAGSRGGENYGWDIFEGNSCFEPEPFPDCPDPAGGFVQPVLVYGRGDGCSVTGGFVYRGCALPDLRGAYFYSDYCSAFIRSFVLQDGAVTQQRDWTALVAPDDGRTIDAVSSFGEDARGELYIVDLGGEVFKLIPASD